MSADDLMTDQHKKILTENIEKIAGSLCMIEAVFNKLVAENIITIEESKELRTHKTDSQRSTHLIHLLVRKGDKAFWVFHGALKESGQIELADTIYKVCIEQDSHLASRPEATLQTTLPITLQSTLQSTPRSTPQSTSRSTPQSTSRTTPRTTGQHEGTVGDYGDGRTYTEPDGDEVTGTFLRSADIVTKYVEDGRLSGPKISDVKHCCKKMLKLIDSQGGHKAAVKQFMAAAGKIACCAEHLTPYDARLIREVCQATEECIHPPDGSVAAVQQFLDAARKIKSSADHLTSMDVRHIRATCEDMLTCHLGRSSSLPNIRNGGLTETEPSKMPYASDRQSENRRSFPCLHSRPSRCADDCELVGSFTRMGITSQQQQPQSADALPNTEVKTDGDAETDDDGICIP